MQKPSRIQGLITASLLVLVMLVSACGGDEPSNNSSNSSENANDIAPVQQVSDQPATNDTSEDVVDENVVETPELAAIVNGEPITMEEFLQTANVMQANQAFRPADMTAFETEVLQMMIDQVLIEQFAEAEGLQVTTQEIENEVALLKGLAEQNDMELAEIIGFPEEMVDEKVREILVTQAVSHYITDVVPIKVTQIHARHILVKDEALARDLLQQLDDGANFAELAQQYSQDPSTAPLGGDLGWISEGDLLQPEVEEVIFTMPVNSRWPEPVASVLGYHVIESLERVDDRPLDESRRAQRREQIFANWLIDMRAGANITRYVGAQAESIP